MSSPSHQKIDRRLARLEGQVGGLRRMVRDNAYCIDVLTQVAAVRSALDQVAAEIATEHVKHCILHHGEQEAHAQSQCMSQDELIEELRETLSRLMR